MTLPIRAALAVIVFAQLYAYQCRDSNTNIFVVSALVTRHINIALPITTARTATGMMCIILFDLRGASSVLAKLLISDSNTGIR